MSDTTNHDASPAFSMRKICKSFGTVLANDCIDFEVRRGEIHALLGENGSGKSTLMSVLSGVYLPDSGEIYVDGKKQDFHSPKDSIACGIGMVYQHFRLAEPMTAAENIFVGTEGFLLHKSRKNTLIRQFAEQYGMEIDPEKKTYLLSVSEKQTVEIIKVLYRGARILVLDEPTAVLTPQEITRLFSVLRKMRDNGCSIVFISHKLNEVMDLCDRVTVLRKGISVETCNISDVSVHELIEKMVGKKVNLSILRPPVSSDLQENLKVINLSYKDAKGLPKLSHISFSLSGGEILGVAGLAGSGQKELCEIIAGVLPAGEGNIIFEGENITGCSPRAIIRKGVSMSFIPEDRLGMGLVASMDIADNVLLKDYAFQPGIVLKSASVREKARQIVKDLEINTPSIFHPVRKLSGGNIQKVILGREIRLNPKLLITAYAVRGLDIHSSYTIYDLLNEQKEKGVAILYIGEDLDVLMELCDRIMVLCAGEITGIVDARSTTKEELGQMMSGTKLCENAGEAMHV